MASYCLEIITFNYHLLLPSILGRMALVMLNHELTLVIQVNFILVYCTHKNQLQKRRQSRSIRCFQYGGPSQGSTSRSVGSPSGPRQSPRRRSGYRSEIGGDLSSPLGNRCATPQVL